MGPLYKYKDTECRLLLEQDDKAWVIILSKPLKKPILVNRSELRILEEKEKSHNEKETRWSRKQEQDKEARLNLILPLVLRTDVIYSRSSRQQVINEIALSQHKNPRTILRLYYLYLAYGEPGLYPETGKALTKKDEQSFRAAIKKYHYSSRKLSLRKTYEFMLIDFYTDNGVLASDYPSFSRFRNFFYRKYRNITNKIIAQKGYSYYQRNSRPLYGKAIDDVPAIGFYEMDATEADVYLVATYNRRQPIGRPIIYMAVDRATQLIAGIHIGLKGGTEAVMECIRNAIVDKSAFCRSYDIDVSYEQWPSCGLPASIITDRGKEFMGTRVEEVCGAYGITLDTLPPYRPELKGTVEKMFDLLQQYIHPLLLHRGAIEPDHTERGAPDYRLEAALTLREYTQLVIHAVVFCNSLRVQKNYTRSPEMIDERIIPTAAGLWQWYMEHDASMITPLAVEGPVLLPRGTGHFTRRGLEFHGLRYKNPAFDARCSHAGTEGQEPVTVAYVESDIRYIWLVENGVYYEFSRISGGTAYEGLSFAEVQLLARHERKELREYEAAMLPKTVAKTAEMKNIVEAAHQEKGQLSPTDSLVEMDSARLKEVSGQ